MAPARADLGEFLTALLPRNANVAVVGPNEYVSEDPTPLYLGSVLERIGGSLTILDAKPAYYAESHGNVYRYLQDFETARSQGVRSVRPVVVIADAARSPLFDSFDLIVDHVTAKCILNQKATHTRAKTYLPHARRLVGAYENMLHTNGHMVFAYPYPETMDYAGYAQIKRALADHPNLDVEIHDGIKDTYRIRNLAPPQERRGGRGCEKAVSIRNGQVKLGSHIPFCVIEARKIAPDAVYDGL